MALQFSSALRNAQASAIQTTVAAAGTTNMTLVIYSGAESANCAATAPTGILATIVLPATFLTSSGGVTTLSGAWTATASATGTAASFRIYDMASTPVCHVQGNVGTSGTDLIINNTSVASGQTVSVSAFGITIGNA